MVRSFSLAAVAFLALATTTNAATLTFNTDPFAGSDALTQPGRQIVGGEPSLTFDIASDVLAIDAQTFGLSQINFANALSTALPTSGVNFIVLQNGAPLAAGTAANAIAEQITEPGAGFFIYFNSGLDLPRLVYSTDLSDPTADLAILARFTNLSGPEGFAALPNITAANATVVPEPASLLLTAAGAVLVCGQAWRRRRTHV